MRASNFIWHDVASTDALTHALVALVRVYSLFSYDFLNSTAYCFFLGL